jgi:hypothetical protein
MAQLTTEQGVFQGRIQLDLVVGGGGGGGGSALTQLGTRAELGQSCAMGRVACI